MAMHAPSAVWHESGYPPNGNPLCYHNPQRMPVPPVNRFATAQAVPPPNVIRHPGNFRPRKLCTHWGRNGTCLRGSQCTFAHGMHELHPEALAIMQRLRMKEAKAAAAKKKEETNTSQPKNKKAQPAPAPAPHQLQPTSVLNYNAQEFVPAQAFALSCSSLPAPEYITMSSPACSLSCSTLPVSEFLTAPPPLPMLPQELLLEDPSDKAENTDEICDVKDPKGLGLDFAYFPQPVQDADVTTDVATAAATTTTGTSARDGERKDSGESKDSGGESDSSMVLPGVTNKRKLPPPLTTDQVDTPEFVREARVTIDCSSPQNLSPAAAAARMFLRRCSATCPQLATKYQIVTSPKSSGSPRNVIYTSGVMSPKRHVTVLSPTARVVKSGGLDSVASTGLSTRTSLQSPCSSAVASSPLSQARSPRARLIGSPVSPGSPRILSREVLLQARTVAQRVQQGPPGLAQFAPTPTSKAKHVGFAYPQPGWLVAQPSAITQPAIHTQTQRP